MGENRPSNDRVEEKVGIVSLANRKINKKALREHVPFDASRYGHHPSLSADWVSAGYDYQSCSWSDEQGRFNFPSSSRSRLRVWPLR